MEDRNIVIKKAIDKLFKNNVDNYIFIYSPPKVGSTTLVSSLRVSLPNNYNVIHIHDEEMLSVLTDIHNVKVNEIIQYITNQNKNVFVIDVYRTPIERKISEYFEKLSSFHFNNTEANINNYNVDKIIHRFNCIFPYLGNGDHYFEKYDIENPINFDFKRRFSSQTINNINFIKLRLSDSRVWNKILSYIFKKDIVLINDYQTEKKDIGDLYNKFKEQYKIPVNFLTLIKECKYFNFYNSENERDNYINKWYAKKCDLFEPYTLSEYNFYVRIYLENQYYNNIQFDHYIDNGCYCKACTFKRRQIFHRVKNGEKITEKIIHSESVKEMLKTKTEFINQVNDSINKSIKNKTKRNFTLRNL